jgi:hypothetical protein
MLTFCERSEDDKIKNGSSFFDMERLEMTFVFVTLDKKTLKKSNFMHQSDFSKQQVFNSQFLSYSFDYCMYILDLQLTLTLCRPDKKQGKWRLEKSTMGLDLLPH